jgi:O-antigen ligase
VNLKTALEKNNIWPLLANGLMVLMPFVMVLSHRSSQLMVSLAALCSLIAYTQKRGWRAFRLELIQVKYAARWIIVTALFLAPFIIMKAHLPILGEALLAVLAGVIIIVTFADIRLRWALPALGATFVLSCALISYELATKLAFREYIGLRWNSFIFNRPVIVLTLLFWPLSAWILRLPRPLLTRLIFLLGIVSVLIYTLLKAESSAAVLGLAGGVCGLFLARFWPRLAMGMMAFGFASAFLFAPVLGDVSGRLIPPPVHETLKEGHSQDRVNIWQSFGDVARQSPWFGFGIGTTRAMDKMPIAQQVSPSHRELLGAGHPHNMFLQVWVELGIMGVLFALILIALYGVRPLAHLDAATLAPRYALVCTISLIALVGHGLWQGWWIAAIAAALAWFKESLAYE